MWSASMAQRWPSPLHPAWRMRRTPVRRMAARILARSGGQFIRLPHGKLEDGWSGGKYRIIDDQDRYRLARFRRCPDSVMTIPDDPLGSDLDRSDPLLSSLQQGTLDIQTRLHKV